MKKGEGELTLLSKILIIIMAILIFMLVLYFAGMLPEIGKSFDSNKLYDEYVPALGLLIKSKWRNK